MRNVKTNHYTYWIITIISAGLLFMGGLLFLAHGEGQVEEFKELGFPTYFLTLLGIGRILGAIVIVIPRFPRLKEWAYAGFVIDLISASSSHMYAGHEMFEIVFPLIGLVMVLASWVLRPPSRKLKSESESRFTLPY
ncbi:DoxX family protein [Cohnella yongneupensis]|uniref:DoxX family protein n=1 Tax=Cohnella yongneupensis TaxID=425006 RepID=A0ABW0QSX4_9BACL